MKEESPGETRHRTAAKFSNGSNSLRSHNMSSANGTRPRVTVRKSDYSNGVPMEMRTKVKTNSEKGNSVTKKGDQTPVRASTRNSIPRNVETAKRGSGVPIIESHQDGKSEPDRSVDMQNSKPRKTQASGPKRSPKPVNSSESHPCHSHVTELLKMKRLIKELQKTEQMLRNELLLERNITLHKVTQLEKDLNTKCREIEDLNMGIAALTAKYDADIEKKLQALEELEGEVLYLQNMNAELVRQKSETENRLATSEWQILALRRVAESKMLERPNGKSVSFSALPKTLSSELAKRVESRDKPKGNFHSEREKMEMDGQKIWEKEASISQHPVSTQQMGSEGQKRPPRKQYPPPKPSSVSIAAKITATSENPGSLQPPLPPPSSPKVTVNMPPPPPPAPSLKSPSNMPSSPAPPTLKGPSSRPPPPPPPPPPTSPLYAPHTKYTSRKDAMQKAPEVVQFYHSLMKRDAKKDASTNGNCENPDMAVAHSSMIGEIQNRSAHLLAIKEDVRTQGDFVRFLIREVQAAAYDNIEDVVSFVQWLDNQLSVFVDERAVLKHFDWPEKKADIMREAAFGYQDLKKLESEVLAYDDDLPQPCDVNLKKMTVLLEKLEQSVYNLLRMRERTTTLYKELQIPTDWMLDNGIASKLKLASVKLAKKYMQRISIELESIGGSEKEPTQEILLLQGVRFAFRAHQFAGGFDAETMRAFEELRHLANVHNKATQDLECSGL